VSRCNEKKEPKKKFLAVRVFDNTKETNWATAQQGHKNSFNLANIKIRKSTNTMTKTKNTN